MLGFMLDVFDDGVVPKAVDSTVDIDTSADILDQLRNAHKMYLEEGVVYIKVGNVLYFAGNKVWYEKIADGFSNLDDIKGVLI